MVTIADVAATVDLFLVFMDVGFVTLVGYFIYRQSGDWMRPSTKLAIALVAYVAGHAILRAFNYFNPDFYCNRYQLAVTEGALITDAVLIVGLLLVVVGLTMTLRLISVTARKWVWWAILSVSAFGSGLIAFMF